MEAELIQFFNHNKYAPSQQAQLFFRSREHCCDGCESDGSRDVRLEMISDGWI